MPNILQLESATKSLENTVDAQKNQIRILEDSMKSEKQHAVGECHIRQCHAISSL